MFDWFVLLIPIFPLLAAIANGLLGSRYSHHTAARLACGSVFLSFLCAIAVFVDVPIVHKSVEWWRTLHQPASLFDEKRLGDPQITGVMLFTVLLSVVAFTLLYFWLLVHRFRLAWAEEQAEDRELEEALAERRAEAEEPNVKDRA